MSLPTGNYRAVLLYAKRHGDRQFYTLDFTLVESGERERAVVLFADMPAVFSASKFVIREGAIWSPADPEAEQPIVNLSLSYNAKWESTRALSAARTGLTVPCDIKAPVKQHYVEF